MVTLSKFIYATELTKINCRSHSSQRRSRFLQSNTIKSYMSPGLHSTVTSFTSFKVLQMSQTVWESSRRNNDHVLIFTAVTIPKYVIHNFDHLQQTNNVAIQSKSTNVILMCPIFLIFQGGHASSFYEFMIVVTLTLCHLLIFFSRATAEWSGRQVFSLFILTTYFRTTSDFAASSHNSWFPCGDYSCVFARNP